MLDTSISTNVNRQFRIEEIPADQIDVCENQALVPVAHFQKEIYATFGAPFLIKLTQVS